MWNTFSIKRNKSEFTMCLAYAGSASCSSLLMFSLSLRGVRPGVKPGVAVPRGVMAPPAWGVIPSWLWPGPGVLVEPTDVSTDSSSWGVWSCSLGVGGATWTGCWGPCWGSEPAAAAASRRWSRSHAAACWGLPSAGCRCWSEPSGSGLPGSTQTTRV